MAEVNEDPPEVSVVLLDTMVELFDMALIEEAQYPLLELAAPLAGDDLNQCNPLIDGLLNDPLKLGIDPITAIIDFVPIEGEFGHLLLLAN